MTTATLELFDNDIPPTGGGDYVITVAQTAADIAAAIPSATQAITFTAPQVSLDPSEVLQYTPAPSATGPFGEVLPSVLLSEPSLPWERAMPVAGCPWLALVIFQAGELSGGDPSTFATTSTVGEFQAIADAVVPPITLEADVTADQPCTYIRVPSATFTATMPRAVELPWLTHVRRSTAEDGTVTDRGVVIANRFPEVPASGATKPVAAVAHLVSVEGLAPWLVDDPVFTKSGTNDGSTPLGSVVVLSLARWTFGVVPDPAESFQGLTLALQDAEYDAATQAHTPGSLALRLPLPAGFPNTADPGQVEVANRIESGYAPLTYHARSGEDAMAWYRGPVTPELVAPISPAVPLPTSDAALIYDEAHGIFDVSLASAWQIGRAAALADRAFGQALYTYRQAQQRLGDTLVDRAARAQFAGAPSAAAGQLTGAALRAVQGILATDVGTALPGEYDDGQTGTVRGSNVAMVGAALLDALAEPQVAATLTDELADDLAPVADWLAGLSVLSPLPFSCLVPDARMLPRESPSAADPDTGLTGAIRLGYLDPNWTTALLSGALSLAVESSRQAGAPGTIDPAILTAVGDALKARCGLAAPPAGPITVLLLRSDLVSGWPTLAVTPLDAQGAPIPVLRADRLSPGVLIALFDGIPASVRIAEPHVALTLGLDEQGATELRNLVPPVTGSGAPPVGAPLGVTAPILTTPTCLRGTSRVLAVTATGGLVPTLTAALTAQGQTPTAFGPAALGLQLVRAPQAMLFDSAKAV